MTDRDDSRRAPAGRRAVPDDAPARDLLTHSGGCVVRTPMLPFATLEDLLAGGAAAAAYDGGARGDDLAPAVADDRAATIAKLRQLVADPVVREAVWVASPDLAREADAWVASDKDDARVTRALLSYATRMAARATPFGLFAGCGAGAVGGETRLELPGPDRAGRRTRLDYGFLAKVVAKLAADPGVRDEVTYRPNTSLYRAGARLRLAESSVDERGVRYRRVAVEEDDALAAALERARGGARLADVAAVLTDDEISIEEARAYVDELVEAQLLVPDLGPLVTGPDPVAALVAALDGVTAAKPVAEALAGVRDLLLELDSRAPGADVARYDEIVERLRAVDPDVTPTKLFQVDAAWPGDGFVLGDSVLADTYAAIDLLRDLDPGSGEDEFQTFREAFVARYESREVPLAEVLDEELGIGFGAPPGLAARGAPLLNGMVVGRQPGDGSSKWNRADEHKLKLLNRAIETGAASVELTDDDVTAMKTGERRPLPDAVAAFGTVFASSAEAAAAGDHQLYVRVVAGPSGARMLGRFCDVSQGIEDLVRRHVADEQAARPDAVLAEVVHLPEGRIGNILARPVLRAYEIPFLGASGAPDDGLLELDDLYVTVAGERIVLRSKRLGREVLPRLTSAHNVGPDSLAVYRFLTALQYQGVLSGVRWSWGPLESAAFLPRVTRGRLVLSRAQWLLEPDEIDPLRDGPAASRYAALRALRERRALPRWVAIALADNELVVDLDHPTAADLIAHEGRRGMRLRLVEPTGTPGSLCATSPGGAHVHEFVLPLVRRTPRELAGVRDAVPTVTGRLFPPGSEWLAVKLYGGPATADSVLRDFVTPLVMAATASVADGWFFVRYQDPDPHVRVRFHGDPAALAGAVLPRLNQLVAPLLEDGRLAKVQVDTYQREVERYGGPAGIVAAERLFRADSDLVLDILRVAAGDEGLDARWRLGVLATDQLLGAFGFSVETRQRVIRGMRDSFAREQAAVGTAARRHAGNVWRRERVALEGLLGGGEVSPLLDAGRAAVARHADAITAAAGEIVALERDGTLLRAVEEVAGSFVHMHLNRLLRGAHRTQEVVVYDLLDRVYTARAARSKQRP